MNKAIFLDKDGTLIPDIPYNIDPAKIELHTDAVKGLKALQNEGYLLIIVSNQSGIARGYFSEADFTAVIDRITTLLQDAGIRLTDFFYCPHHPEGTAEGYNRDCQCRKPSPGMLEEAAAKHNVDLNRSWMIGDILNDVEAGNRAGCRTILVDKGYETEWLKGEYRLPAFACHSIDEAAQHILEQQLVNENLERL
jgi:D-glycero-D-manno-heptose 1,7-bisphosphate phosphatase